VNFCVQKKVSSSFVWQCSSSTFKIIPSIVFTTKDFLAVRRFKVVESFSNRKYSADA
jgi:hypothetical protein